MLTYFSLVGLPEWTALSRRQRRFVWRQCAYPLLDRWQMKVAKTCIALAALCVAVRLGFFDHMSTTVLSMLVLVFLLPDLFDALVVASHRQQVSAFITHHGTEIQTAG